jgi:hypothetical protein
MLDLNEGVIVLAPAGGEPIRGGDAAARGREPLRRRENADAVGAFSSQVHPLTRKKRW